jgi:glyoxylase-like metal-dependent hydrolase (beta-lactamase superfamily II)
MTPKPQPRPAHERQLGERLFEVAPEIYRIALPTDFSVGNVNAYFVHGPDPVLVDTGVAGEQTLGCLAAALAPLGCRIEDIATVLLTHVHVDHAGSARAIRERSGAPVYLHQRGHARLTDVEGTHERQLPWYQDFFSRCGFAPEMLKRYFAVSDVFLAYTESCPELEELTDGEVLKGAGGRSFVVHEAFGHTGHHVAFVLPDAALAFTGDHVLPHITANPTLEAPAPAEPKPRPLLLYQQSLKRTERLAVRVACPGHDRPFEGLAARCRELRAHQLQRCEQVLDVVRETGSSNRKQLSLALFGKVPLWEIFLTISEIQAALEWLEHHGQIRIEDRAGVDWIEAL